MKKLFKLGLVALMGVCGLVGIGRAQTVLTVDTAASTERNCTLQDDGSWKVVPGEAYLGLVLKVVPAEEGKQYRVSYTVKDKDGKDMADLFYNDLTDALNFSYSELGSRLPNGTYTVTFTLEARETGGEYEVVEDVEALELQLTIAKRALKLTTTASYEEVADVVKTYFSEEEIVRWAFATQTAPEFKIEMENGTLSSYSPIGVTIVAESDNMPVSQLQITVEEGQESATFTLKPSNPEEGDGDDAGVLAQADATVYLPDGNYTIMVMAEGESYDDYFQEDLYVRIGKVASYGFVATGDHFEEIQMGWSSSTVFDTFETTFAVTVENVAEGWYADVQMLSADKMELVKRDTARSKDSVLTFTLENGYYYGVCTVYDADGNKLWTNSDGFMSMGLAFEVNVTFPAPAFAVKAVSEDAIEDTVIFKGGSVAFDMFVTELAEGDEMGNYQVSTTVYTREQYTEGARVLPQPEFAADSLRFSTRLWDGEYVGVFALVLNSETVKDTIIYFNMTENPEPAIPVDPTFTVKVAGDTTMDADTILFNGMAAFDIFVECDFIEGDGMSNYGISAELYTREAWEDYGAAFTTLDYQAADSLRANFDEIYNGDYVVHFVIKRLGTAQGDLELNDGFVDFYFAVTNYEAPVVYETPDFDVNPAGNFRIEGDTALIFADTMPLFDVLLGELEEGDDFGAYKIEAVLYTELAFDTFGDAMKHFDIEAADSTRVSFDTTLVDGAYVATFALQTSQGEELEFVEIFFSVEKKVVSAITRNELAGVNVYPNPTAGAFNVTVPERARIEIFGMNGALVMSREANNAGVEAFNLNNSGVYFVRVMAGNKTAVKRVVVR